MSKIENRPTQCRILGDHPLTWLVYFCLIGLLTGFYFGSLGELPLDIDDGGALRDNEAISEDFTVIFSGGRHHPSGRPLGHLVRWVVYLICGNDVPIFHLFSVSVHATVAFLLALLVRKMGVSLGGSLLGGLLFLVNIAHFKAVHHIAALEYLLSGFFTIMAMFAFLRFLSSRLSVWLWIFYLLVVGGILTHVATIAVLPFSFYWAYRKGSSLRACLRYFVPLLALLAAIGGLILWKLALAGGSTTGRTVAYLRTGDFGDIVGSAMIMLIWFLSQLFIVAHTLPVLLWEIYSWELYCGGVILAAGIILIYRKIPVLSYCAVWILFSLLPFSLQPEQIITDIPGPSRYLYLASAGSSVALAWAIYRLSLVKLGGCPVALMVTVILLVSSYVGLKKLENLSFYTSSRTYAVEGQMEKAAALLKRAIKNGSDVIPLEDAFTRYFLALLSFDDETEAKLDEALRQSPNSPALNTFKRVIESMNSDATELTAPEIELRKRGYHELTAAAYKNLALGYLTQKDIPRAVQAFRRSLEYVYRMKSLFLLARSLAQMEDGTAKALQIYRYMLDMDLPDGSGDDYAQIGMDLQRQGQVADAIRAYRRALEVDENHLIARVNLGWNLYLQGEIDAAIAEQLKVLERQAHSVAQFNLGLAYLVKGDIEKAQSTYAEGIAKYGATEAEQIGAVEDLKALITQGTRVAEAREILKTYWNE